MSRPQSDLKMIAPAIEAKMPPTIVQPAIASAERLKPASSTSVSNRCHQRWPPTVRCAVSARIDGDLRTAQPRLFLARHRDVLRHAPPERAVADVDRREKIAKQMSARTETITKIISHGDVMTSSIQVVSNVPCGVRSRAGVVYLAVAGARPATFTRTTAFCWGGSSER